MYYGIEFIHRTIVASNLLGEGVLNEITLAYWMKDDC